MNLQNLERLLKRLLLANILTIVLLTVSCKANQQVTQVPIRTETKIVEKLVPVIMPADSTSVLALFKCDSTNRVIMQKLSEAKTSNVSSQIQFNNGYLTYKTQIKHDTVWLKSKDSTIYQDRPIYVPSPVYTNKITFFQELMIKCGYLFWTILIVWGLYKGVKLYLKM